ncbi:MAG: hypothetical protein K2X11_08350 [Acetobacteraceae bacterium]|nr:hypothetical protein [Acetobacteraceae bacterium]
MRAVDADRRKFLRGRIGKTFHGWHPSPGRRPVEWIGAPQGDACNLLDLLPGVASWEVWPVEIVFTDGGRHHAWPVDFGLRRTNGTRLALDVLSTDEAVLLERRGLSRLFADSLSACGIAYAPRTHASLVRSRQYRNAAYVASCRTAFVGDELARRIQLALGQGERSLRELSLLLPEERTASVAARALAWHRVLEPDLDFDDRDDIRVRLRAAR